MSVGQKVKEPVCGMRGANFEGGHNSKGIRPPYPQAGMRNFRAVGWLSAGDGLRRCQESRESTIPIQVWPGSAEADENPPTANTHFGSHFDQQAAPGAGLAFAQRIGLTAAVEVAAPRATLESFGRHGLVVDVTGRCGLRWGCERAPQAHQQVMGGCVQIEAKEIGYEAMIAGAVDL